MKNTVDKSIGIILSILLFFLFSYASAQQKQDELGDAEVYNNWGYAFGQKGQYDLTIADFTKAIEIGPKYAMVYNNRGHAYKQKGQYDLAIADYTKAIEINPEYAMAYNNRGIAYYSKKEYDKSWEDMGRHKI